jgi:hypothetical protein
MDPVIALAALFTLAALVTVAAVYAVMILDRQTAAARPAVERPVGHPHLERAPAGRAAILFRNWPTSA